jgi:hypothetical protein
MVTMAMFTLLLLLVVIDCVSPALSVATTSTFEISGSSGSCSAHFRHVFLLFSLLCTTLSGKF